ncbi:MAG: acyl-CoA thioesterase [Bacteroidia bacterium]
MDNQQPIRLPVKLSIRIDWSELDYFGHVNNVQFYKYIQSARVNFWEQIGLRQHHLDKGEGPLLAHCSCDFRKPLEFPGELHIACGLAHLGNSSFGLKYHLSNQAAELAAEAEDRMVMFDFHQQRAMRIPDWLRERMLEL